MQRISYHSYLSGFDNCEFSWIQNPFKKSNQKTDEKRRKKTVENIRNATEKGRPDIGGGFRSHWAVVSQPHRAGGGGEGGVWGLWTQLPASPIVRPRPRPDRLSNSLFIKDFFEGRRKSERRGGGEGRDVALHCTPPPPRLHLTLDKLRLIDKASSAILGPIGCASLRRINRSEAK